MLDPDPSSAQTAPPATNSSESDEYIDTAPPRPLLPPIGKDLHLTILILPALARYKGTIRQGIKSRDWGDDHTGASFLVLGLRWLDEGSARGRERGARARHAYLHGRSMLSRTADSRKLGGSGGLWRGEKGEKGKAKENTVEEGEKGDEGGAEEGPSVAVAAAA